MKTWSKAIPVVLGVWGWLLAAAPGLPAAPIDTGAIQAIQQATDPSAAVAAFANGFAIDRNNPKLYDAYVTRMVDLGLPELAYHQAAALTTLDANNGLAWGVVGYVDARRGDTPAAISAIVLAGQGAPDNQFVQRTAGEIVAWYDLKADKAQIADNAKSALDALRARFSTSSAFAQAYDTAKKAYATQTNVQQAPTAQQAAPAQPGYGTPPYSGATTVYGEPAPVYYSNYYYDWGSDWWWYPCGFFAGFTFFPFSTVIVFDHDFDHHHFRDFDHRDHDRDGIRVNDRQGFHDANNQVVWHRSASGSANFFGTPAQPNAARVSRSTSVAAMTTPRLATSVTTTAPRTAPAILAQPRSAPVPSRTVPTITRTPTLASPQLMAQSTAPIIVRPAPSAGLAVPSHQAFAPAPMARPSGGGGAAHGNQGGGSHGGGSHR